MTRPKSMPDSTQLANPSSYYTFPSNLERHRKNPSLSLAAGLIIASESSPKSTLGLGAKPDENEEFGRRNLFYAYAQKSDYPLSPPSVLTFANVAVAQHWWNVVKKAYPECTREGPQLFILKGEDLQRLQDDPRLASLKNKWFYTTSEGAAGVIPIQDEGGQPVGGIRDIPPPKQSVTMGPSNNEGIQNASLDLTALSHALDKMTSLLEENAAQIKALRIAQSEGLQRMQDINESNASQIKSLGDSQAKLQAMVGRNASNFIAYSNSSFAAQEQVRGVLQQNAEQIKTLAEGQHILTSTCTDMLKAFGKIGETLSNLKSAPQLLEPPRSALSTTGNRILPPPRKLNRRVKGVWYEYDM